MPSMFINGVFHGLSLASSVSSPRTPVVSPPEASVTASPTFPWASSFLAFPSQHPVYTTPLHQRDRWWPFERSSNRGLYIGSRLRFAGATAVGIPIPCQPMAPSSYKPKTNTVQPSRHTAQCQTQLSDPADKSSKTRKTSSPCKPNHCAPDGGLQTPRRPLTTRREELETLGMPPKTPKA